MAGAGWLAVALAGAGWLARYARYTGWLPVDSWLAVCLSVFVLTASCTRGKALTGITGTTTGVARKAYFCQRYGLIHCSMSAVGTLHCTGWVCKPIINASAWVAPTASLVTPGEMDAGKRWFGRRYGDDGSSTVGSGSNAKTVGSTH